MILSHTLRDFIWALEVGCLQPLGPHLKISIPCNGISTQESMQLFTYGSLMFPEIWQRVVCGDYRSVPAMAYGYARYALADDTYPGMIANPQASVEGVLYFDVAAVDVAALDAFEGCEYRRELIDVVINSGESVIACAYIFTAEKKLSALPWEPQAFQMSRFIDAYCRDKLGG